MGETSDFYEQILKSAGKALIGTIPVVGVLTAEVFGIIFDGQINKRQVSLLNDLAVRIKELENSGLIKIDDLKDNHIFIDVLLEALNFAQRTSNQEKIKAFQNIVLNTACRKNPSEFYTHTFLQLLNRFTYLHLAVLNVAQKTLLWFNDNNVPWIDKSIGISVDMWRIEMMLCAAIPEINGPFALDLIWRDLQDSGLVDDTPVDKVFENESDLYQTTVTPVGMEFNRFIDDPSNYK